VTESASPGDWSDATARTDADETRLAPDGARVERLDPPKEELAATCLVSSKAPICSRKAFLLSKTSPSGMTRAAARRTSGFGMSCSVPPRPGI
jgi:hypothetical protein